MKGMIFTELIDMIESLHGYSMVDNVFNEVQLASKGAYTSVGSYAHEELVTLLMAFSKKTGSSLEELQFEYGKYMFGYFTREYASFFEGETSALPFLAKIESKIHPQVKKLYPTAELPTFVIENLGPNQLDMTYQSIRCMGDFAAGLIRGCLDYFKEEANVSKEQLSEDGSRIRFRISKAA